MNSSSPVASALKDYYSALSLVCENIAPYCLDPVANFTRKRKLTPDKLITFLTAMQGKGMNSEICDFFQEDVPTASAVHQARKKLLPEALRRMLHLFNRSSTDNGITCKGWNILACDGSCVNIPYNPEDTDTLSIYGFNKDGFNQIHLNALYDCLNGIFYDCSIDTFRKAGECRALQNMIKDHNYPEKSIITADRGYENYELIAQCQEANQKFLIRVKDIASSGILKSLNLNPTEMDIHVSRILTRLQTAEVKKHPEKYRHMPWNQLFSFMPPGGATEYTISFRVIRVQLSEDSWECLVTNLTPDEFSAAELKAMYHLRWNEEGAFKRLKYSIDMLSFHSKQRRFIEQEVYAALIAHNLTCRMIQRTDEIRIEEENKRMPKEENRKKKHARKANFSTAVTNLRKLLRREIDTEEMEKRIKKYLVPVRPDRKYERNIRPKSAKGFSYRPS